MQNRQRYPLFNVDSILEEAQAYETQALTSDIDKYVAALAFKNFDFVEKRLPFLVECQTCDPLVWLVIVEEANHRYWLEDANEGVAVYSATESCGCIRTYRFDQILSSRLGRVGGAWATLRTEATFYALLDTPAARGVFEAWHHWTSVATQEAAALAEGRFQNTAVRHSLILTSGQGCLVCADRVVANVRTTAGFTGSSALLVQLPLCTVHLEAAKNEPSFLGFLEKIFFMSLNLPELTRYKEVPDVMIPVLHQFVADGLVGIAGSAEKRENGWVLKVELPGGWHWVLRLNSLTDYAYQLFCPQNSKKAAYRADSAPDHPELPFFPDHEHSKPGRKSDFCSPSFLYGLPFFDLQRLRDVGAAHGAC